MKIELMTDGYALSPMQQGMLFHYLAGQEPGVDVEQIFCVMPEELEPSAFKRAWHSVVARHTILRTTFHWAGLAEPRQQVHPAAPVEFTIEDWWNKSPLEQGRAFETVLENDRRRGFDLSEKPPMRLALFRLGHSAWRLLWTFHHLLLDGRAVVMVLNEVFACYEAFVRGDDLELPSPRPYHEFINWCQQQDWTAAEAFWRRTLKGFAASTSLGLARPADAEVKRVRGEQQLGLSASLTAGLKSLARAHGLTVNTLLQGAWALLLSRYSREEDVLFGVIRAGRRANVPGAGPIVGMLINTVPVRIPVLPETPLVPWLQTLRQTWAALRDFEHTPLARIVGWSDVPPGSPLFETIFNFQDPSWDAALRAQGGKWLQREFGIRSQSNYPLVVDAYGGDAVIIKILYDRRRLEDDAVGRILRHLSTLLEGMAANPGAKLCDLPLLTEVERKQILVDWNETKADFPKDKCVHELFQEQVLRTPNALAVADRNRQVSYAELNELAELLAVKLRKLGVRQEVCVGVCLERSVAMVAAKLAVWKAGGAYVPLDPAYPRDRLAFMLEDAKMPVLVTQRALRTQLQFEIPNLRVLCVDDVQSASLAKDSAAGSGTTPHPRDLAYLIYTSGSTGTPKGVEIEHRSLVNLISWHQRTYQVGRVDRATQIATPAFDASVWELWPYLTCGASIHIPDEETRLSPHKLVRWLTEQKITLAFIPTPIAEAMLDLEWPQACALRALLTGGDKLHRPPPAGLPCALLNHYGPTENTVVTTWTAVSPTPRHNAKPPPIGRPIDNTRVLILDPHLQPLPVGVPGELHIGGVGLARGYHHHPELTAEKFIPDPFQAGVQAVEAQGSGVDTVKGIPQSLLYRTGDLVRWLPDGQIEFVGRLDNQVKIRGQRIELGEIEAALSGHPMVRESVVIAHENAKDQNCLAAYVVPTPGAPWQPEELRRFLKQKLPEAMLPTAFLPLERLPLTSNGKVDRKALPVPDFKLRSEKSFVAPCTPAEQKLAAIWREVLGVKQVGIHDNFFELGGHSLTATQVAVRASEAFQIELPLQALFDSPTLAEFAAEISARAPQPSVAGSPLPKLSPPLPPSPPSARLDVAAMSRVELGPTARLQAAPEDNLPLSFSQERLWFLEQLEPDVPFHNIPVALRVEGALNVGVLERAVAEILRRHETLRTVFHQVNGRPVAAVAPAAEATIQVLDLRSLPDAEREEAAARLMSEEARQPFDLSRSPLLRTKLLRLAAHTHVLLFTTHHLVCDGWSLGIFYRELASLYNAFLEGRPSPLPELQGDYAGFVRGQRARLAAGGLERQLDFWKRQLQGAPTTLDLPTDRRRPPVQTYRGATQCLALPHRLTPALKKLARREEVTHFMVLLAAFEVLLHRYTGQPVILVGSPSAGRMSVETEPFIGFFLNTLVLRGDLTGDPTFRELLRRVRTTALEAYAHQELPFEKLVDALQPARDLSRSPVFQVMFALQNQPLDRVGGPKLTGLEFAPVHVHSGTAKFDLMLSLEEGAEGFSGFIEFNTDLFDAETIARFAGHYQVLLEAAVRDAAQRVSQLPLLTEPERRTLCDAWNNTQAEFPKDRCVSQLFEEQVERSPQSVAVVFDNEQLTYRELNQRANELARQLQVLGVGPDTRVGLSVRRSPEMVIGLLGILKAGGAYVPLDPAYPRQRLVFLLEDSQATVLLTQESLRDHLGFEPASLKVRCLDGRNSEARDPASQPRTATELKGLDAQTNSDLRPDHLAYVIYTSGSTGTPKGVMVTHRNVVNFLTGMDRVLGPQPGVWLAVTSISFDISALELLWTLTRGFRVVIQPDADHAHSNEPTGNTEIADDHQLSLPDQILRHGVTHLQCTPSLARTLLLTPDSAKALRALDQLLLGGETLPVSLARQLREIVRGDFLNLYGPTETTIWSAFHRVDKVEDSIPIGRPIANTQMYILDSQLQPVAIGVPGEIFIGGEGVARGYLNQPELTAEKFILSPAGSQANARLYRTGDLGRWRADGTIEFLGRLDHQVKIRGHRVELGEIETALGRHPGVSQCVVAAREDSPGDLRLVAYMVSRPGAEASASDLRRFLRQRLPEAMMPAAFVRLDALPLTPNGKVNRQALPAPEMTRPELDAGYVAPHSEMETAIAGVWRELLHVEKVGLHDNFFDLGGNSLLMVQVQARLRDTLGFALPVVKLFQYPTVGSLADCLRERPGTPAARLDERGRKKQAAFARGQRQEMEVPA